MNPDELSLSTSKPMDTGVILAPEEFVINGWIVKRTKTSLCCLFSNECKLRV